MNITKNNFVIVLFIGVLFCITGCSIYPWKTIKFISYPANELESIEISDINENNVEISNFVIDNVFFYFVTNGIEDTMYTTKAPYSINFVFKSYDKNTIVSINSVRLFFDNEQKNIENHSFPLNIKIATQGYMNPIFYSGNFETEYIYNLSKVKEISVIVNVTIKKNNLEMTKDLKASASKKVKRGLVQYRY